MVNEVSTRRKSGPNGRLRRMAEEQGTTLRDLLMDALKRGGSIQGAARELDCNAGTIRAHMVRERIALKQHTEIEVA